MADASSIAGALASLKAGTDIIRGINAANASVDNAQLKLQIAGLADTLLDARMALLAAQEEIVALRSRVSELESSHTDRAALVKRDNVYYFGSAGGEEGPFCPRCFEVKQARMPVTKLPVQFSDLAKFRCPECRATY